MFRNMLATNAESFIYKFFKLTKLFHNIKWDKILKLTLYTNASNKLSEILTRLSLIMGPLHDYSHNLVIYFKTTILQQYTDSQCTNYR